jgi:hypothetical protein
LIEFIFKSRYSFFMRRPILIFALYFILCAAASAATGKVIKVLPQFLDLKGRSAVSPSLYDRDAYQAYLREHTNDVSGMRFAVQWKASGKAADSVKLRVEIRGVTQGGRPPSIVLEQTVKPGFWFNHWSYLPLTGEDYKKIGEVTAWRATLWDGDKMIGEQKSFIW